MTDFIAIFAGLSFGSIIYLSVFWGLLKKRKLELIDWFLLSVATFNGLGFGFVIWSTHCGRNFYSFSQSIMSLDNYDCINYIFLNIILVLVVFFSWIIAKKNHLSKLNKKRNNICSCSKKCFCRQYFYVSWLTFFIALIAYWIYTKPYGGFKNYLNYSAAIRAGIFLIKNPFSFLKRFGSLAYFSSYLFYGLLIDKNIETSQKKHYLCGFCFSVIFSIYVLISWVGRVGLALYVATFLLGYILYSYKTIERYIRKIFFFVTICFLLIIVADAILGSTNSNFGIVELFAKELSFPLSTYYFQINFPHYRWFKDILVAPLYVLPTRIWSGIFNIETLSSYNTFIHEGARKGEMGVTGEIPVDMLSFALMQGSVFGVVVVGILWGIFLYHIESLVNRISIKGVRAIIYARVILNVAMMNVMYGDTIHLVTRNFEIIVGFMFLYYFVRPKLKNRNIVKRLTKNVV